MGLLHPLLGKANLRPWCPPGHVPLVSLLLNYYPGLDLERRDQRGLTALMKAAVRDRSECVAALLMAGAWGWTGTCDLQSLPKASSLTLSQLYSCREKRGGDGGSI